MLAEQQKLDKKIISLKNKLKKFPKKNLICAKNGTRFKWYITDGKHCTYLPKHKRTLAEQLALKKLISLQLDDALNEKASIHAYLNTRTKENSAELYFNQHPEFQNLLSTAYQPVSADLAAWTKEPFEHNPKNPGGLIHKSLSGNILRSKSEVFIDTALYSHRLPFRYECALQLGDITLFPDFTIRHPLTGKTYYWEHFGRMDTPSYAQNACMKLQTYSAHGIIPTINLITTYETGEHPLTYDVVEKIIQEYFL